MKKQIVLAAAVLGVAAAQTVPTAASRAEARAKGTYELFVGGSQPGYTDGVQSAKLAF